MDSTHKVRPIIMSFPDPLSQLIDLAELKYTEVDESQINFALPPVRWAYPDFQSRLTLPMQGFKLHLTATVISALDVFEKVVPWLIKQEINFKTIGSLKELEILNAGFYGVTQVGKFMTVYPTSNAEALKLAKTLHQRTVEFTGPRVPSDFPYAENSIIYYRYGTILPKFSDEDDQQTYLVKPSGEIILDKRDPRTPLPEWVTNIFNEPHSPTSDSSFPPLFADRFIIVKPLRQRGRGGVHRAIELHNFRLQKAHANSSQQLGRQVILKQARYLGEVDSNGIDAQERLRWQEKLLIELDSYPAFPKIFDMFRRNDDLFLVMEDVGGVSLQKLLLDGYVPSIQDVIEVMKQAANILQMMHSKDIVFADLSPDNLIVNQNGQLYVSDLEYAYRDDGPPFPQTIGTPGFFSRTSEFPPRISRDIYALGALGHVMLVSNWYRKLFDNQPREEAWNRPNLPKATPTSLQKIIRKCMSEKTYKSIDKLIIDLEQLFILHTSL